MHAARPSDIALPFLWIAAIGFAAGFLGYLLAGGGALALAPTQAVAPAVETLTLARDQPREI